MSVEPEMSVIIPVGDDRDDNLRLVLSALRAQTFKNFEVILCCDGVKGVDSSVLNQPPLQLRYSWIPRGTGHINLGAVNRNRGAKLAKSDWLVFIDSDIVLNREALAYYYDDFCNFPVRVILGPYHWLPPMEVTEHDLRHRWDDFAQGRLPKTKLPPYTHNVHPDPRKVPWDTVSSDALYCDYRRSIMTLSGNMALHRRVYEGAGGFWEELPCGIDGAFGLAVYQAGFSVSFQPCAVGYHLYHERVPGLNGDLAAKLIRERFHQDDSWLGRMNTSVGWHWDSKNG